MRIILFASGFNNYDISIKKALQSFRHEVIHYSYRSNLYSTRFYVRLLHKIRYKINNNYETVHWNRKVIELCEKSSPDIVFVLKGEVLYPETIDWIKKNTKAKIICWFMDVIKKYPQVEFLVPLYDYFFTYEPDDIDYLKELNPNIFYLPLAYDPDNFFPINNIEKKWDLCFIGTWSKNREEFLLSISNLLQENDINCIFFMNCYSLFRPSSWEKWFKRNTKYQFFKQHKYFSLEEINLMLNQSKVCLNIHQEFTKNALSIRTFEIIGSGQLQLVENFDSAKALFKNSNIIITYNTGEDLVSRLKMLLLNPHFTPPTEPDHAFKIRMKQLLNSIRYES